MGDLKEKYGLEKGMNPRSPTDDERDWISRGRQGYWEELGKLKAK